MDSGVKIKIVKNDYQNGALDFCMFNPEKNDYDEINAFSDENRLLRYTSDTRSLKEYADEMMQTLVETYSRIIQQSRLEIKFYGTVADAEILKESLEQAVEPGTKVLFTAHCETDPNAFKHSVHNAVAVYNTVYDQLIRDKTITELTEITPIRFSFSEIKLPNTEDDAQSVLSMAVFAKKTMCDQALAIGTDKKRIEQFQQESDAKRGDRVLKKPEFYAAICRRFKEAFLQEKDRIKKAYNAVLQEQINHYIAHHQSKDWSSEQLSEFSKGFSERLQEKLDSVIKQALCECFSAVWQRNVDNVKHSLIDWFGCEKCELIQISPLNLDTVWRRNPFLTDKDVIFDGRRISKKMAGAVQHNARTKTYSVDYNKYGMLFGELSPTYKFYCERLFNDSVKYFCDDVFASDLKECEKTLPDEKEIILKRQSDICRKTIDLLKDFSAVTEQQQKKIENSIIEAEEGGDME